MHRKHIQELRTSNLLLGVHLLTQLETYLLNRNQLYSLQRSHSKHIPAQQNVSAQFPLSWLQRYQHRQQKLQSEY
jgi:hypothetical protein